MLLYAMAYNQHVFSLDSVVAASTARRQLRGALQHDFFVVGTQKAAAVEAIRSLFLALVIVAWASYDWLKALQYLNTLEKTIRSKIRPEERPSNRAQS